MTTKIRSVIVVAEHLIYGGTEKYTLNLIHALAAKGVSVVLVTGGGPLLKHVQPGIEVYRMPIGREYAVRRKAERKIRDLAIEKKADVIHAQCRKALVCSAYAGKTLGIPIVSHEHHIYEPEGYPSALRDLSLYADKVVTIGPYTRKELLKRGFEKQKVVAVRPGIDLGEFAVRTKEERALAREALGIAEKAPVALCISRVVAGKGIDKLIRGFAEVAKRVKDARLLIVGDDEDGMHKPFLRKMIKELGLQEHVQLLPGTFNIRKYHVAADVFCYPALAKGMSVMEAMSMELPVVGKKTVRRPLMVEDGKSGLMTEPTAQFPIDPHEIAEKLTYLLKRPRIARRFGKAARKRIEDAFTIDAHVDKVLSVYRKAVREKDLQNFFDEMSMRAVSYRPRVAA